MPTIMPTRVTLVALALAFGGFSVGIARADEPRTINDCEKISAADAYNQCLAKFGPESKVKSLEPERPGDMKANGAEAAAGAKPLAHKGGGRHGGGRHRAAGGGRKRASFTVSHRRHK
ncbi:hypothetical protein [Beijerinckia sp. L45]|uniref:hypothetical protein n=1 Tax=Beijerinckia sp. L45 TaxID=1641855 RepID=UPI00131ACE78|nr:hypothetical protein [Beijerinckia sp. L45]